MRILIVASEAVPYAKTGGLGDVVGTLPRALARLGHDVDVVLPRYRGVSAGDPIGEVAISAGRLPRRAKLYALRADGVRTVFIDQPAYFDRDQLYGTAGDDYPDNAERFAFLAYAALALADASREAYDVAHAHDWQAGLLPVLMSRSPRETLRRPHVVFTIHNLAYQGLFAPSWLSRIGLGADMMHIDAMEYWGRISFLKAGLRFSRVITTVSPRYSQEIQTPEYGFGFDGILRRRSADLVGILNGIDYDEWDPQRDAHLPEPFSASNLKGKAAAKRRLLEMLGLEVTPRTLERPLVGMVSRLVDQKGFDLLSAASANLIEMNASFALLGTGERRYEQQWRSLADAHPDRIGVRVGFDESLAHLIEGGADIFLMPSHFEPCGLNQMYSLRYGTVPVVRAVGGLFDTVHDYDERTGDGTGFTFEEYSAPALLGALQRAFDVFQNKPVWQRLQAAGMREDHSWEASARQYEETYLRAVTGRTTPKA